jgi:DnaJ-like protein
LRTLSGTRRSIDIHINGQPDDFEVRLGTGEWKKNLLITSGIAAVATVGVAVPVTAGVAAGVALMARKFEVKLWSYVNDQINYLSANTVANSTMFQNPVSEVRSHQAINNNYASFTTNNIPEYYSTLEVSIASSQEEIAHAFRMLTLKYHPDRNNNSPESHQKYMKILEAYRVLSDESIRREYDQKHGLGIVGSFGLTT